MLTYQMHDLAAVVEVAIDQPEYSKHRSLLVKLRDRLDFTAEKLFIDERMGDCEELEDNSDDVDFV